MDEYSEEQKLSLVNSCPANVFTYDTHTESVLVVNPSDCIFCRECIFAIEEFRKRPEDILGVEIAHSSNKFTFSVEATGSLLASDIVRDGLQILAQKINTLKSGVQLLNTEF